MGASAMEGPSRTDDASKPSAQALPPVSQPCDHSKPHRSSTSRGSEASSLRGETQQLTAQVTTQEIALQTDAPWTDSGLATMKAIATTPREQRILILQRCDRR